jgi:hypothetical protein
MGLAIRIFLAGDSDGSGSLLSIGQRSEIIENPIIRKTMFLLSFCSDIYLQQLFRGCIEEQLFQEIGNFDLFWWKPNPICPEILR